MVAQAESSKALEHPVAMLKELRANAIAHKDEVNDWHS
jgi:predicted HTH transcriptional regulator